MSELNIEKIQGYRESLLSSYLSALESVSAENLIKQKIKISKEGMSFGEQNWQWADYAAVRAFAIGKPADQMMRSFVSLFPDDFEAIKTLTITKQGHSDSPVDMKKVIEASHPVLDGSSLFAGQELINFISSGRKYELMIGLISGGGSSLAEVLRPGIDISDVRATFEILLGSGATIHEMNQIRKCLSEIKGGGLLRNFLGYGVNFILSDVVGNDLGTVSSGMTVPSQPTRDEVWGVVQKYDLESRLNTKVIDLLNHYEPLSVGNGDVENVVLGSNEDLLRSFSKKLETMKLRPIVVRSDLNETAETGVKKIVDLVQGDSAHDVFLFGGELTIEILGSGKGGRNQELAMRLGRELGSRYCIMCVGTDGTDGPTDAAGGFFDALTLQKCLGEGISLDSFLEENNSYEFLDRTSSLIKTGPTGTNVMDLYVILRCENDR